MGTELQSGSAAAPTRTAVEMKRELLKRDLAQRIEAADRHGVFNCRVSAPVPCAICESLVRVSQARQDDELGGRVCPLCFEAAEHVRRRYESAETEQRRAFANGLARLIRDIRSGIAEPEPVFFRSAHG